MRVRADLVITYPPDFDGELYIQVDKLDNGYKYSFIYACDTDKESPKKILSKASSEIASHANRWNWHEK